MLKNKEMDHQEAVELIYAFLDDELSHEKRSALNKHKDACADCQKLIACELKFRTVMNASLRQQKAPFDLKEEIISGIEKIERERVTRKKYSIPTRLRPLFVSMSAGLIFLGVISGIFLYKWQKTARESIIFSRLAAKRVVFAPQENLYDISSSDAEELVTWFKGKVNFSFSIPFSSNELDLLGGRLSELDQESVVHLFYEWGNCRFSFFTFGWESKDFPGADRKEYKGKEYYITECDDQFFVLWKNNNLGYALVCDDEEELFEIAFQIL